MNAMQGLMMLGALLLGGVLAWAGAAWWFGRRLKLSSARIEHLERSRQQVSQQVSQARRQVEQLQRELADLRQGQSAPVARAAPAEVRDVFLPLPPESGVRPAKDGFAPTQIQPRRG